MDELNNNKNIILKSAIECLNLMVITDEKANIVSISKRYMEILGVNIESVLGKPIKEIVPTSKIPYVLKSGKDMIGDLFKLKNGAIAVCNRLLIKDDDGNVIGVISNATIGVDKVDELNNTIKKLQSENIKYKNEVYKLKQNIYSINSIISKSSSMEDLKNIVTKIAKSSISVLITGETGTGKEVFANAIHMLSDRSEHRFVKINCAAIPKDILESELFGYEDGAFSGALKSGKIGKFEFANNGTILLDEISEMSLPLQAKLLRVLQENEIERVGGLKSIKLNLRLICSTNQNIVNLIKEGKFREDLYYRINVFELKIPPLRERYDDIPSLCDFFIDKINRSYGLGIVGISKGAIMLFNNYNWRGNVRELEHVIERSCVNKSIGNLEVTDFDFLYSKIFKDNESFVPLNDDKTLEEVKSGAEKIKITRVLIDVKGNKTKAAKILGINRTVLYVKIKKYNIE